MGQARRERRNKAVNSNRTAKALADQSKTIDDDCRLLKLPAELRNLIYDFVVEDARKLEAVHVCDGKLMTIPSLAGTCHQIRNEILPMFMDDFTEWVPKVIVHVDRFEFRKFMDFLDRYKSFAQQDSRVEVRIRFPDMIIDHAIFASMRLWLAYLVRFAKELRPKYTFQPLPLRSDLCAFEKAFAMYMSDSRAWHCGDERISAWCTLVDDWRNERWRVDNERELANAAKAQRAAVLADRMKSLPETDGCRIRHEQRTLFREKGKSRRKSQGR